MARPKITAKLVDTLCSDSLHPTRAGLPGWTTVLGRGTVALDGQICDACSYGVFRDSISNVDAPLNEVVFHGNRISMTVPRRYPSGEEVSSRTKRGKLRDVFTASEITNIRAKLKAWFRR